MLRPALKQGQPPTLIPPAPGSLVTGVTDLYYQSLLKKRLEFFIPNESGSRRLEVDQFCATGNRWGPGNREIRKEATMTFPMVEARPI